MKATAPAPDAKRGAGAEERRRRSRPQGASKPPHLGLPRRRTRARAGRRDGSEGTRATAAKPLNGERAAERPSAAPARERRPQAAIGGGAASPPRRARSLLRPARAAICQRRGQAGGQAQRRGGRASECRAPRAYRFVARTAAAAAATTSAAAGAPPPIGARAFHRQPAVAAGRLPRRFPVRTGTTARPAPRTGRRGTRRCIARTAL